ncbi:PD-(D/E)XK nuclease family protein [Catenulispora subtropica]|uniref:PD-(D/E)XK endonuclease-like domain-containing protein n=1 Tax=Catenulispora subtropica TaxID=450798 RepID=A0ABP5CMZ6_9ACTN
MTERNDPPSTPPDAAPDLEAPRWRAPAGTSGAITLIRTNLAAARLDPRDCPTAVAAKARPLLAADPKPPYARRPVQTFAMGPLMAVLDRIEHGQEPDAALAELHHTRGVLADRMAPAHPGLLAWTRQAATRFLAARAADQNTAAADGRAQTYPIGHDWVAGRHSERPDARGATTYEQTAWGRRYASPDGTLRELWLPSQGSAKASRPAAEIAAAAYVVVCGRPAEGGGWKPYAPLPASALQPAHSVPPDRVRIIEFGCRDGEHHVLADWDRQQCLDAFARDAAPALAAAVERDGTRPGSSCADCKAITGCQALTTARGLLEIAPPRDRPPRSTLSASDLRYHHDCPAMYHLVRMLNLKSGLPENPAIRLGRGVDAVLNRRHAEPAARLCRPGADGWTPEETDLIGDQAETARGMLEQHADYCPLDGLDPGTQPLPQQQVTCFDPDINTVFINTPDLLYPRGNGWVWRETKASPGGVYEGKPLLENYPQLALAVLMINAGALGGDPRHSLIELEVLGPDDTTFLEISPARPEVAAQARAALRDHAQALLADREFPAHPGRACTGCEALPWCAPGQAHITTDHPDPTTGARP